MHQRVPLPYELEQGLEPFMSAQALKTTAVDWQQGVLSRLNELVQGTELEDKSVLQTVIQSAQDPTKALVFNYASEALNNSFFLSTLSPTPSQPTPNSRFTEELSASQLESFSGLIAHFSAHVAGLHPSSGAYVWLVTNVEGRLGVVGTYAGGTPLVAHRRQTGGTSSVLGEPIRENDSDSHRTSPKQGWNTITSEQKQPTPSQKPTMADTLSFVRKSVNATSDSRLHPLACISLHPHCYMQDYGVWGREEYVKNWWSAVDWRKVEQTYEALKTQTQR
ncbi:hypothetical protein OIO90_005439 [Microbotryomycetes sp. JL221]|nr:hypothetical protein OIO90_005439 [Microbotryomycetes sp. JL221]